MELTILMPCLNEAETLAVCIQKAKQFLSESGIDGEVLISDNGSTDMSRKIAENEGARVVITEKKGYGSALINGTREAHGKYVIMGDADDSYDFLHLMPFVEKLREGYDLVMGNRFAGGIEKGAMPWSHKYIGNPVLSFIGRLFFHSKICDFHCGLRAYNKASIIKLNLQTTGMEYASEMVVKAELSGLRIAEVPTTLSKDGRSRKPHLRSFHDGWRHLKFLLMYAPNWLFLYPGFFFLACTLPTGTLFVIHDGCLRIHTLLFCAGLIIMGLESLQLYLIIRVYSHYHGFLPSKSNLIQQVSEDRIIAAGGALALFGVALGFIAFSVFGAHYSGNINAESAILLAVLCLIEGIQCIFFGFVIGIMKVQTEHVYEN